MTTATPETDFDPTKVPPFPVITIDLTTTPDGDRLLVNGAEVIPSCEPITDAAVAAAAVAIRDRGLHAARVAANIDGQYGKHWLLVVDEDGNRYPLPEKEEPTRRWPAWLLPLSVATVVAAVAIGVASWALTRPTPAPAAPPPPTATPAELPVLTVDAWSTHALWATPREGNSQVVVDPATHDIITATKTDVVMIDREIGNVVTQAPIMSSVTVGPVLTTIDGVRSIAVETPNALVWWPADHLDASTTRSLPLDQTHQMVWAGSSPLLVLPNQEAGVIVDGAWSHRTVPAGATAIRADGGTLVAVDANGRITTVTTTAVYPPDPHQLEAPAPEAQAQVLGTSGNVIVLAWSYRTPTQYQVLETRAYDITTGNVTAKFTPAGSSAWDAGPGLATVSDYVIDTQTGTATQIKEASWRTTTVTEAGAWGTALGRSAHLSPTGTVTYQQNIKAAVPLATDRDRAYVATAAAGGQSGLVYALPATASD